MTKVAYVAAAVVVVAIIAPAAIKSAPAALKSAAAKTGALAKAAIAKTGELATLASAKAIEGEVALKNQKEMLKLQHKLNADKNVTRENISYAQEKTENPLLEVATPVLVGVAALTLLDIV